MKKIRGKTIAGELTELSISGGIIKEIRPIPNELDGDTFLSSGFFDIQVNGYKGIDYSSKIFSGSDLEEMVRLLRISGTTKHLPTIITSPKERIIDNLKKMAAILNENPELEYSVPGFHIEGPFISAEDGPRGAHDGSYVRKPDFEEFQDWQTASGGRIRIVTLAPEHRGAIDFIRKITNNGVIAAIGHSNASPERISEAVNAGARLSTHLGNGNHSMIHRLNNNLWPQFTEDKLSASIISDGEHLPASLIKTIRRTKGPENLILVSDASPFGGMEPGKYCWDNISVRVDTSGRIKLADQPFLAGAGKLLAFDLQHFIKSTGCSIEEAVKLCTENPCRLLSLPEYNYHFEKKSRADIIILRYDETTSELEIEDVIQE